MIKVREIVFGSKEYQEELELRNEILRKPLGMDLYSENLELEKEYFRIGAFLMEDDSLVGALLLVPIDKEIIQMKQMAVRESFQGRNVGKQIIEFAEEMIKAKGFTTIILNGRKNACEFYKKLGYQIEGEEFQEIGIPHFKMVKKF